MQVFLNNEVFRLYLMPDYLQVISLHDLSLEVDIPENEELEEFIIEAIRINAISVRLFLFPSGNFKNLITKHNLP